MDRSARYRFKNARPTQASQVCGDFYITPVGTPLLTLATIPPLPDALLGPRLKLLRFEDHFAALKRATRAFLESQPYRVPSEVKAGGYEHIWRAVEVKRPDPRLGVIIGDCLHNLRSALDHLAWQLVVLEGDPSTQTAIGSSTL
jgi:hypothetical protein